MMEFCNAIGLSRPTVSRYFNDPKSVRKSSRDIIEAGLEQHDYRPNFHASNLQRKKTRAVGVIVPSIVDPFFSALVNIIEKYAEARGYLTILQCSQFDAAMETRALMRLISMNVTGIAMAPLGALTNLAAVTRAQSDTRVVFMDSRLVDDAPLIGTDNNHSISLMVKHLCHSGSAPKFMALPKINVNLVEREQAYEDQMRRLGHRPILLNPDPPPVADSFEQFGHDQFLALPSETLAPGTTILCVNDRVAFGVLSAASKRGLKVGKGAGDDLRVAGHDNQFFSQFTSPALTTVGQDAQKIGTFAAQALLEDDEDNDILLHGRLLEGTLFLRDSA